MYCIKWQGSDIIMSFHSNFSPFNVSDALVPLTEVKNVLKFRNVIALPFNLPLWKLKLFCFEKNFRYNFFTVSVYSNYLKVVLFFLSNISITTEMTG